MKKIYKFLNWTWQEIPEGVNPAMRPIRTEKSLIIFRGNYQRISNGGFVVAEIPKEGDIIKRAVFWRNEFAEDYAYFLAQ